MAAEVAEGKIHRPGKYATPTLVLAAVFAFGNMLNFVLFASGATPTFAAFLIGIALYNMAFTIWHEAAHGNVARSRRLNDAVGIVASIVNVFPAFYRQRHDHLLHHRHLLDIEYDRTVYRARRPIMELGLAILEEMRTYGPYREKHGIRDPKAMKIDRLTYVAVVATVTALVASGNGFAFLVCCALPRLVILPIHVLYVCYLPHVGLPNSFTQGTRTLRIGPLKYAVLFHNFHAVHHLWPTIPWYLYERYYHRNFAAMQSMGVQLAVSPWEVPVTGGRSRVTGSYKELPAQ